MTRFERWSLWATSLLTFLSGLGYLWTKYFVRTDDPWAVVNHPLEPWLLKAHVIVAPLLVFAVGLVFLRHVWRHIQTGTPQGYRSGIVVTVTVGPMVLTGYLIQVVTHVGWLRALAIAHIVLGLLYFFGLGVHQWFVARTRRLASPVAAPGIPGYADAGDPATAGDGNGGPAVPDARGSVWAFTRRR